jgi:signal peptidase I
MMNVATLNKIKQLGFVPVKKTHNYTTFKSNDGIAISYNDGNIEGFTKSNLNETILTESGIRQKLEMLLAIGLGITYFTTDITIISGRSMEPTYKNYQIIIKTKASTDVNKILVSKNSIVKFISPTGDKSIKRIMGIPGDEIEFDIDIVRINGKVVDQENSEPHPVPTSQKKTYTRTGIERKLAPIDVLKLKSGEYFVMGDNPSDSIDSKAYGPIKDTAIISVLEK